MEKLEFRKYSAKIDRKLIGFDVILGEITNLNTSNFVFAFQPTLALLSDVINDHQSGGDKISSHQLESRWKNENRCSGLFCVVALSDISASKQNC